MIRLSLVAPSGTRATGHSATLLHPYLFYAAAFMVFVQLYLYLLSESQSSAFEVSSHLEEEGDIIINR